jgi:hypothetical protein
VSIDNKIINYCFLRIKKVKFSKWDKLAVNMLQKTPMPSTTEEGRSQSK